MNVAGSSPDRSGAGRSEHEVEPQETEAGVSPSVLLDFLGNRLDETVRVVGAASLSPGREGCLSFGRGQTPEQVRGIETSRSSIVLIPAPAFGSPGLARCGLIAVDNPRREFARLVSAFFVRRVHGGISPAAVVDPSAQLGPDTVVGPGAYIAAGVVVGADCRVGANAVLLEGTVVGDGTSIGPNSTIGHVGFGYAREDDGTPVLIPHTGGVLIGSNVDIGANTCVDRGTLDDTLIEDHVKIDNLVHIAHNCRIEQGAFVIATAILCGGVRVGPRAWIAPNASVREQLRVGADAVVGLASTVVRDVPDGVTVVGSPAKQVLR